MKKDNENRFENPWRCEAFIEDKMCLEPATFEGSAGHLICETCLEGLKEKNPDITLKSYVMGYKLQAHIHNSVREPSRRKALQKHLSKQATKLKVKQRQKLDLDDINSSD